MILVEDKIEGIKVTVEIDENADHHHWSGCPRLKTENYSTVFDAVDALTVIKAVKTCKTVYDFDKAIKDTWAGDEISEPIKDELNREIITNIRRKAVEELDTKLSDEDKYLFDFNAEHEDCLDCAFMGYACEYNGLFHILTRKQQVEYLVQSVLADC